LDYAGAPWLSTILALKRILAAAEADALIVTGHSLAAMAALGSRWKGKSLLAVHFHHRGTRPDWHWRLMYALASRRFGSISFPSDFVRKEALEIAPGIESISSTVRNPVVPPEARVGGAPRRLLRAELGIPDDCPIVGNAGWLIKRKRFDVFLRTARRLLDLDPRFRFLICGDGDERENLQRLSEELGIADAVIWLGWLKDIERFYESTDVLLFNSDVDALGMTPIEAAAHGIPVVASVKQGGLAEILGFSDAALIIDEHDVDILAEGVIEMLRPEDRRKRVEGQLKCLQGLEPNTIALHVEALLQ
jgi:glycosyltransferase involved in cell wall biosynthesis